MRASSIALSSFIVLSIVSILERSASATTLLYAPWGVDSGQRVEAGLGAAGTSIFIDWKNRVTGECQYTYVGETGELTDDVTISLTNGNDRFTFAANSGSWTPTSIDVCGYGSLYPVTTNNHYITIVGGNGDDRIFIGPIQGIGYGGSGNDFIVSDFGAYGQGQDDVLFGSGSITTLDGGDGNDCLKQSNIILWLGSFNCGAGNDSYDSVNSPSSRISCETASTCNPPPLN
jgi:Ca2+-binding RTX toxin-like protein